MATNQYPNILAGQDLTADLLNAGFPYVAFKTSATSRATNTTATDDPDLILALVANATYQFEIWVNITGAASGAAGDFKMAVNYTGSTSAGTWIAKGNIVGTLASYSHLGQVVGSATQPFGTNGGTFSDVLVNGMVTTTTAGNLSLQWAQNASNATSTNVRAQSYMKVQRVA